MKNGSYRIKVPTSLDLIKNVYWEYFKGDGLNNLCITYDNGLPYLQQYWEGTKNSSISIKHFLEIKSDYLIYN